MPKKRGKPVSFDAMIKFFMRQYNIPTKKDVTDLTRPFGNVSSTAPRATDSHSTSCFNTTPWSDSSTGYPNLLTPTDSFSKEL